MTLDYWFPTLVYTEVLKPPAKRERMMVDYVDKFRLKHPDEYSITGDVKNEYQIASQPEFNWLNKEVYLHCIEYLKAYGLDTDKLTLYSSKSWPVSCNPDKMKHEDSLVIDPHNHANSHLSVVYYLQTDVGCGGELVLHASPTHPIRYVPFAPFLQKANIASTDAIDYQPIQNQIVIFPSSLEHEVHPYYGLLNRYSITYDIIITGKEDLYGDNEMCIINPNNWKELTNA